MFCTGKDVYAYLVIRCSKVVVRCENKSGKRFRKYKQAQLHLENSDGVHLGHRKLTREITEEEKRRS